MQEGRPNLIDLMKNGQVALVVNTPSGKGARTDEGKIRAAAVAHGVTCITTLAAAHAAVEACRALRQRELTVSPLQSRFPAREEQPRLSWGREPPEQYSLRGLTPPARQLAPFATRQTTFFPLPVSRNCHSMSE